MDADKEKLIGLLLMNRVVNKVIMGTNKTNYREPISNIDMVEIAKLMIGGELHFPSNDTRDEILEWLRDKIYDILFILLLKGEEVEKTLKRLGIGSYEEYNFLGLVDDFISECLNSGVEIKRSYHILRFC